MLSHCIYRLYYGVIISNILYISIYLPVLCPVVWILWNVCHVPFIHMPLVQLKCRFDEVHKYMTMQKWTHAVVHNATDPLQVVIVGFLGLYPLKNSLVLMGHPQNISLSPSLVEACVKEGMAIGLNRHILPFLKTGLRILPTTFTTGVVFRFCDCLTFFVGSHFCCQPFPSSSWCMPFSREEVGYLSPRSPVSPPPFEVSSVWGGGACRSLGGSCQQSA